jgi:hypothetical protein
VLISVLFRSSVFECFVSFVVNPFHFSAPDFPFILSAFISSLGVGVLRPLVNPFNRYDPTWRRASARGRP